MFNFSGDYYSVKNNDTIQLYKIKNKTTKNLKKKFHDCSNTKLHKWK